MKNFSNGNLRKNWSDGEIELPVIMDFIILWWIHFWKLSKPTRKSSHRPTSWATPCRASNPRSSSYSLTSRRWSWAVPQTQPILPTAEKLLKTRKRRRGGLMRLGTYGNTPDMTLWWWQSRVRPITINRSRKKWRRKSRTKGRMQPTSCGSSTCWWSRKSTWSASSKKCWKMWSTSMVTGTRFSTRSWGRKWRSWSEPRSYLWKGRVRRVSGWPTSGKRRWRVSTKLPSTTWTSAWRWCSKSPQSKSWTKRSITIDDIYVFIFPKNWIETLINSMIILIFP